MKIPSLAPAYQSGTGCLSSDSMVGSYLAGACAAQQLQVTVTALNIHLRNKFLPAISSPFLTTLSRSAIARRSRPGRRPEHKVGEYGAAQSTEGNWSRLKPCMILPLTAY